MRAKFNLVLLATCMLGMAASAWYLRENLQQEMWQGLHRDAEATMEAAIAVRRYTSQQIKPLLDADPAFAFRKQAVPAFAAREVMALFHEHYPGQSYREAALNPMNPKNKALGWEVELIQRYQSEHLKGAVTELVHTPDSSRFNLARPIRITDKACLYCHASPDKAPEAMVSLYGRKNGFGWRMGDIVGAQIVSVPAQIPMQRMEDTFTRYLWLLAGIFSLLFVVLNLLLSALVLKPLNRANALLTQEAGQDALTGAISRRAFLRNLDTAIAQATAEERPLCLVMIDLDHFKAINDQFGHNTGDRVLHHLVYILQQMIKQRDCLGRLGGEEFGLLLPETAEGGARVLAEQLRIAVMLGGFDPVPRVTASFGLAEWRPGETASEFMHRADISLYHAKRNGRNCLYVWGEDDHMPDLTDAVGHS